MADKDEMHQALEVAKSKAGGASSLARALRITPQAVNQWNVVPPERVLEVERFTGVSRHLLRPDVFGSQPDGLLTSVGNTAGVSVSSADRSDTLECVTGFVSSADLPSDEAGARCVNAAQRAPTASSDLVVAP